MQSKQIKGWKDLIPLYDEKEIKFKKVIEYFDFFNYLNDFQNVYEPAEDSFLMIDCILAEADFLKQKSIKNSIEIGCGSGLVSLCFLDIISESRKNSYLQHYCVDINKDCLELANRLFVNYDYKSEFIQSNLFEFFKNKEISNENYLQKFDFIFFNPVKIFYKFIFLAICYNR